MRDQREGGDVPRARRRGGGRACETGHYYTPNATGTFLWELLSTGERTREDLVAELARASEQDEAAVTADVQRHLDDLRRENPVIVR